MAPTRLRKRASESSSGTSPQRSPIKKRKLGITLSQKQALIDNLQLEISERARRLRAQYNIQAQQLRSRVEMRVNRIPTTLRRLKMCELPAKSLQIATTPARTNVSVRTQASTGPSKGRNVAQANPTEAIAHDQSGSRAKAVEQRDIWCG
ncbi:hypothetical protein ONZ43_g2993 [Nemania bipapillata]|uniref:Uncharacterized protein n=1 Tax=Nemania bipapillata TaxID=110536 RepID=A0ACC2IYV7_9PEZI|nr:hypothetical protein ONZ43_g2993 [Nemania bipapillata]